MCIKVFDILDFPSFLPSPQPLYVKAGGEMFFKQHAEPETQYQILHSEGNIFVRNSSPLRLI